MNALYQPITEIREREIRAQIARLRAGMFACSEDEQNERGREIEALKAEAACSWDARHNQVQGERLTAMGF